MGKGEKSAPAPECTPRHEDRGYDEGLLPALEDGVKGEPKALNSLEQRTDCCKTITRKHLAVLTAVLLLINITLIAFIAGRNNSDSQRLVDDVNGNQCRGTNITLFPPCPKMWVWYLGKCYNFSKKEGDWTSCNDICASWNSSLAVIETEAELDFLKKHKGTLEYWIGLRNDQEGIHRWADGTIFNEWFTVRGDSACAYLSGNGVSTSRCHAVLRCLCSKRNDYGNT